MENNKLIRFILGLILMTTIIRLIPHLPNVTPVGAIAILGGVYLKGHYKYIIPIIPMIISDLVLGMSLMTPWIYVSFILIVLFSEWRKRASFGTVLSSSLIFFIISNLGVWSFGGYGYTIEGLISCYVMAIPFFGYTLIGDVIWTYTLRWFGLSIYKRGFIPKEIIV